MLAHLRTEAYPVYASAQYPPAPRTPAHAASLSFERNVEMIEAAKCANRLPPEGGGHERSSSALGDSGVASAFKRKGDERE